MKQRIFFAHITRAHLTVDVPVCMCTEQNNREIHEHTSMHPMEFEPKISVFERPNTIPALNSTATGIGLPDMRSISIIRT